MAPTTNDVPHPDGRPRLEDPRRWRTRDLGILALLAVLIFWVPVVTLLRFPAKMDELYWHLPAVHLYERAFPTLNDMRDVHLSMLPLFHGILAWLGGFSGTSEQAYRLWMLALGPLILGAYILVASRLLGAEWRRPALALAAFPYFGVTYFVVMTDYPALLAFLGTIAGQYWYLRTGRVRALWLAGICGLAAVLVRQNAIYATAIFGLMLLVMSLKRAGVHAAVSPGTFVRRALLPLLLPCLGVTFQIWLWHGIIPEYFRDFRTYFDRSPSTWTLSMVSIAANIGYYFLPLSLALVWSDPRTRRPRTLTVAAAFVALAAIYNVALHGAEFVNTYGTYNHVLRVMRQQVGVTAAGAVFVASLFAFLLVLRSGWTWARAAGGWSSPPALALATFATGIVIIAFGLVRIYERHTLPLFALAALMHAGAPTRERRLIAAGWWATIAFGAVHSAAYAISVFELG